MNIQLLLIDPQRDFTLKGYPLCVDGADDDMKRVGRMIRRIGSKLTDIHVTLDSHHFLDIAHPCMWVDQNGNHPAPFVTKIPYDDVRAGKWRMVVNVRVPAGEPDKSYALYYTRKLLENKRYDLTIWPPHCLIGSEGAAMHPAIFDALIHWEGTYTGIVNKITKGSNFKTEHYSGLMADVPDPDDDSTLINMPTIQVLKTADIILIAGEARYHCVANTLRDIADNFGDEHVRKMVLLDDGMSAVDEPTSKIAGQKILDEIVARGMKIDTTENFLKAA